MRRKFVASSHLGDRPSFSVMHIYTIIVFYACKFLLKRFDQFVYLKHSTKSDFLNFDFLCGDPTLVRAPEVGVVKNYARCAREIL